MRLQRESSFAKSFAAAIWIDGRLIVFEHSFAIDFHSDLASANGDVLSPPLVVFTRRETDVHQPIKTAGFDPVGVTDVDLAFDAGARKSLFLVSGVKINSAIGTRLRHHIDF